MEQSDAIVVASFFQRQLETAVAEGCLKFTLHRLPPESIKEIAYEIAKTLGEPAVIESLISNYPKLKEDKTYALFNSI